MGIFSNLFKPKFKPTVETDYGLFILIYNKNGNILWSKDGTEIPMTVKGNDKEPNEDQIKFLSNIKDEVNQLSDKISDKFIKEFKEAEIPIKFKKWDERFKLVGIEIIMVLENVTYWNITFQDSKTPFAHFTIFIEGDWINPDFSIDT